MSFLGTVRAKLVWIALISTLAALVAALAAMIGYDLREYHKGVVEDVTAQAQLIATTSDAALAFDDATVAADDLAALKHRPQVAAAAVYSAKGRLLASYTRKGAGADFPKLPGAEGLSVGGREATVWKRVLKDGEILGTVYLKADYQLYERLADYLGIAVVVLAIALLIALATSTWLQKMITGPISAISGVARDVIAQGDYSRRATKMSSDEIGALADAFNGMLVEVERRNHEIEASKAEVLRLNSELEERVKARTLELETVNRELEGFSYSISHDLRSPLRAIDGYSLMLEEDYADKLDDEGRRLLKVVRESSSHMAHLIDDLLRFSQLGRKSLAIAPLDMRKLAEEVVADLAPAHPEARIELGSLPAVTGDRAMLKQVWVNLISNALKYSSKKNLPYVEIGGREEDAQKLFWVRDNGAGFDMKYYEKLFGVFQRLHRAEEFEGTGVGLAIVERVIARHGGKVWAESGLGEGAVFRFALPKAS